MPHLYIIELFIAGLALATGDFSYESIVIGAAVTGAGFSLLLWCAGHALPGRIEGGDISGPWRFMRHPEALARFLIVVGFLYLARRQSLFIGGILIVGYFYRKLVAKGDQELKLWLGPTFATYQALTPSFIPHFFPTRIPSHTLRTSIQSSPWSMTRSLNRKAYWESSVLCLAALTFLLVCRGLDFSLWWQRSASIVFFASMVWHYKRSKQDFGFVQKLSNLSNISSLSPSAIYHLRKK